VCLLIGFLAPEWLFYASQEQKKSDLAKEKKEPERADKSQSLALTFLTFNYLLGLLFLHLPQIFLNLPSTIETYGVPATTEPTEGVSPLCLAETPLDKALRQEVI